MACLYKWRLAIGIWYLVLTSLEEKNCVSVMAPELPKYAAFKSMHNEKYLEYIHQGSISGFLQCSTDNLVSIFTKFELEPAKAGSEFVNIRCCYNNKYWASSNDSLYMVTPFVDKPHEDQYSWPCTLFKVVTTDVEGTYYLYDVKLQTYVALCNTSKIHEDCLTTRYSRRSVDVAKYFYFIDFETLLVLPKHVAFKGDNGNYLSAYWYNDWEYLQFSSDDIGDPKVSNEIFHMNDGSIRIKLDHWGKFWKRDPNWILANSTDTTGNNKETLFWPVRISKNVVALRNLGNNCYCKRLTADDKTNCLNAAVESITKEAHLEIEEPIISREIYNVDFRTPDARIYGEKLLTMANGDASNGGTEPVNVELTLKYTDEKSKSWDSSLTMSLGVTTSIQSGVPEILEGKIETHFDFTGSYAWGETLTESRELGTTYTVNVPAKTRMKVTLLATKGMCDVPFSYTQRDTLRTGEQVIKQYDDGVYVGANCYNFKYDNNPVPF